MNYPNDENPRPRSRHPLEGGYEPAPRPQQPPREPQMPITINMDRKPPVVTFVLIGINVLVFVFGMVTNSTFRLWELGAINGNWVFRDGEYYRLLTAMFLHGGAAHLFFNMYALYILGVSIEQMYGRWRFLAIYLLGGLTGSVASAALNLTGPQQFGVGASGAVFALLGAQVLYFWRYRKVLGAYAQSALRQYGMLLLINLFFGLAVPNIDNTAHIGGLVGGALLGFLLAPELNAKLALDYLGNPLRVIHVEHRENSEAVTTVYGLGLFALTMVAGFFLF